MNPPPALANLTIYYGVRWFLLMARTFVLHRETSPYRRLSATLMIATGAPIQLEVENYPPLTVQACLLAPNVRRQRITAVDSNIAIFDLPIETPHFTALEPLLRERAVMALPEVGFEPLHAALALAASGRLDNLGVAQLRDAVVHTASGQWPQVRPLDARIAQALHIINERPFGEARLPQLAATQHLSPSRLRQLFKQQTGCNLTQYMRWAAVWRAVWLWSSGKPWTEIAHDCGFHDLPHLDRAFNEVFGLNPSTVVDPHKVRLLRCA